MLLNLQQELSYYHEIALKENVSLVQAFERVWQELSDKPVATDAIIECTATMTSDALVKRVKRAFYALFAERELSTQIFTLPQGKYHFKQLEFPIPESSLLEPLLTTFLGAFALERSTVHPFFLRLFKERPAQVVVQILLPANTKDE